MEKFHDSDRDSSMGDPIKISRAMRAVQNAEVYKPTGRTVIICLDGTGDQFDADNSNIVHFVSCLKKSDPSQVTYYQSGIGTYDAGGLSGGINAAFDAAVGSGLGVHVRDAYRFLMENYKEGDKICIFGFSRGAYTARCVAGMVHKVGLLPAHNSAQVPFAYKFYKDDTEEGREMSAEFKRTFCMNVNIYMVGVWDSVASVGFIPRKLPLSSTPTNAPVYFRHAMALDERRAKFKTCRYRRRVYDGRTSSWKVAAEITPVEAKFSRMSPQTDALEVWFAGCHCDVGGGAVKNEVRHKLAQVPLRWMIRQCFETDTGIIFKAERLVEEGLDVHTLSPIYQKPDRETVEPSPELIEKWKTGTLPPIRDRANILEWALGKNIQDEKHLWISKESRTIENGFLPEKIEDWFDSQADVNDMLATTKTWWILEMIPIKVRFQDKTTEEWQKKVRPNLGRSRVVQDQRPNLHWTVAHRMNLLGYKSKITMAQDSEWNIVY